MPAKLKSGGPISGSPYTQSVQNYNQQPEEIEQSQGSFFDRLLPRSAARAYETVKGGLGSAGSTVQSALGYLSGQEVPERVQIATLLKPLLGPLAEPAVHAAARGVKSLTGRDIVPTEFPTMQDVREKETEPFFGKERIKAQGFGEEVLDATIQNLPLTYALGAGNFGAKLVQDIFGTTGMKAAEKLGAGPVGQIAGGLAGGSLGRGALKKFFSQGGTPQKLGELAKNAEEQYWTKAKELGTSIKSDARKYAHGLENLVDEIRDTTAFKTETQRNDLLQRFERYLNDASSGEINASKLTDRVKEINESFPKFLGPENKTPRKFIERAQKLMFAEAEDIGKKHPEWFKTWEGARDITRAVNFRPEFLSILDDFPWLAKKVTSPILHQALGIGGGTLLGGLTGGAAGSLGILGAKKGIELWNFYSSPATKKLLGESVKNVVERNIPQLAKSLVQLNKEAEKFEEQSPMYQRPSGSRAKLKRGGLIAPSVGNLK
jgi:hypothetical protein